MIRLYLVSNYLAEPGDKPVILKRDGNVVKKKNDTSDAKMGVERFLVAFLFFVGSNDVSIVLIRSCIWLDKS